MGVRADAGPDVPSPCAGGGLLLVTSPPEATSFILTAVFGILGRDDSEASVTCFIWLQKWWRGEIAHLDPPPWAQQAGNWERTEGRPYTLDPPMGFTAWLCVVSTSQEAFPNYQVCFFSPNNLTEVLKVTRHFHTTYNDRKARKHCFCICEISSFSLWSQSSP